ncbi:50S ribosomal protein L29, partial [Dysosmobacter welbionis]
PGGRPPQRGGHRHLPGPGLCGGPGGQAGHHPLRPVPPAHGRDAGAGGLRPFRPGLFGLVRGSARPKGGGL